MKIDPEFQKTAILAAQRAGAVIRDNFRKNFKIKQKEDSTPVTNIDVASEKLIKKLILSKFPDHHFVGEEGGGKIGKDFTWFVDPLDGTTNFILGIPLFSVSLVLVSKEEPILAVVFNPVSQDTYWAQKEMGAFLNKEKINVNKLDNLNLCKIEVSKGKNLVGSAKVLSKLAPFIRTFRYFGADALALCNVAAGKMEGFVGSQAPFYDVGAGIFIAREAGAKVTDFEGNDLGLNPKNILVSNGKIHKKLLKLINN